MPLSPRFSSLTPSPSTSPHTTTNTHTPHPTPRRWNTQPVCALDVTNPEAVQWFVTRLRRLQSLYGIDGFKFDGGEPCFLPPGFKTHRPISHATEYTRLWVSEVAGQFQGGPCEVRMLTSEC